MAAAKVASEVGVHRTAQALALDSYGLRRRTQQWDASEASPISFVELPTAVLRSVSEPTIELEVEGGASRRVCMRGADLSGVMSLSHRLWKQD